ncbi:MAG: AAA family ATPase [Candidatus Marinimicrobia bacterium]|nr:AAA family ATPase [Candidatus Neomarinimicrobiota bacterium]
MTVQEMNAITPEPKRLGKIISTISNKGGVGKTVYSIEIANQLSKHGKKVLLIDTDLNTGDISIKLSLRPNGTLIDFLEKKITSLEKLVIKKYNFDLIPGSGGSFRFANINYFQKVKFIKAFKAISEKYDYTILDLGAGIERTTLDFALSADYTTIVTTPEDVQTGYGCAKAAAERMYELENRLQEKDKTYRPKKEFSPLFVFNKSDKDLAHAIFSAIKKATEVTKDKFGIEIQPKYLGSVEPEYKLFGKSYAQLHTPISVKFPHSGSGRSFQKMAHYYLMSEGKRSFKKKESPINKIMRFFSNENNEQEIYAAN